MVAARTTAQEAYKGLGAGAERAKVSPMTLHRAAVRGEVPFAVVAGRRVFDPRDLDEWSRRRAEAK